MPMASYRIDIMALVLSLVHLLSYEIDFITQGEFEFTGFQRCRLLMYMWFALLAQHGDYFWIQIRDFICRVTVKPQVGALHYQRCRERLMVMCNSQTRAGYPEFSVDLSH